MSDEAKHDFILIAYDGHATADRVYDILRDEEKRGTINIRTAAVITRKTNGKIRLDHKRRVTVIPGATLGLLVGALLGGPLAGAAVGGLIGATRSGQRQRLREYLQDKLGPNQSALALLVNSADWPAVYKAIGHWGGEPLEMELTAGWLKKIEVLASDKEVARAMADHVEEVKAAGGAEA